MLDVIMLNGVMLNVVMLNVVMLNRIMLNKIMLNGIMLSVIMLDVVLLDVIMLDVIMLTVVASEIKFLRCLVQPSKVNHENSLCWTFDSKLKNENIATNGKNEMKRKQDSCLRMREKCKKSE